MRQLSVSPRFPHFPACLQGPLLNIPSNCPPPPSFLPLGALGSKNLSATLSSCLFSCCASRLLLMHLCLLSGSLHSGAVPAFSLLSQSRPGPLLVERGHK